MGVDGADPFAFKGFDAEDDVVAGGALGFFDAPGFEGFVAVGRGDDIAEAVEIGVFVPGGEVGPIGGVDGAQADERALPVVGGCSRDGGHGAITVRPWTRANSSAVMPKKRASCHWPPAK